MIPRKVPGDLRNPRKVLEDLRTPRKILGDLEDPNNPQEGAGGGT